MHAEMRDNWIKIGLITLTVMMFISVFSVKAENTNSNDLLTDLSCPNEELVLENIEYIRKGVDIWNSSKVRNEELLNSILNLVLGTGFTDGCLYVVQPNDALKLKSDLADAGLSNVDMVNGLIGRLNNSGYISPLEKLINLE